MYEFDDEEGHHVHSTLFGPPYDAKKKLTCTTCLGAAGRFKQQLCDKYGWSEWPADIKVF